MNAPIDGYTLEALASIESEQALLGGLMLDDRLWDVVGDLLTGADFYRQEHREIFEAIAALITAAKPVDIVTVFDRMGGECELATLNALAQFVPSANNARQYAENIRQRSLSRKMLAACTDINALALNHTLPFADRLDQATSHLVTLMPASAKDEWMSMETAAVALLQSIDDRVAGNNDSLATGLADLDELLNGGLRPGQLVIVGARPSMGKSALAVQIGVNMAKRGEAIGMFSLEMPASELASRQLSMLSHVHLSKLMRPERLNDWDWSRITPGVEEMRRLGFYVSETPGININQLRSRARKLKRQHGLKALIVDYIGLMVGLNPKESRNYQLGECSRGMKNLAKELGIPIICLAQLGREVEKRTGARPILSDLRDSGEIEQDADIVIFIDRPIHRNPEAGDDWKNYAEAIVAKQRQGATGSVNLRYVGENVSFMDWEGDKPARLGRSSGGGL